MLKVNNRRAIANLSKKSLKANRLQNIVAILAITLTAILFTSLFTVGGSLLKTIQNGTMHQLGTSAHGGYKFLTQSQYDILLKDPKIKDISYNILIGFGENPEFNKTYTEIRWTEEKAAKWSFSLPTTGRLPEDGLELATTTKVLDALKVPHKLGEAVHLEFTSNGIKYSENFTLCGFWEDDIAMRTNSAFVSREYCDKVAPVLTVPLYEQPALTDPSYMAGSINPSIWFSNSWNIEGQMEELNKRCGFDSKYVNDGVNWAYGFSTVDFQTIMMVLIALFLIGISGYLIIYNIFYISVTRDIRFYGLLKTIGTTGRQLKRIVRRQAFYLCLFGIPLGLLLGYFCGRLIMPAVLGASNISEAYVISINPIIFVGATIFSLLTVWISCIKPCKLVAMVSPIEAVKYTGINSKLKEKVKKSTKVSPFSMAWANLKRDKKKTVLVILSLGLSMILLNATYTIVKGFDMEKYLENNVVTDFLVSDASINNAFSNDNVLDGVSQKIIEDIKGLDGLEGMGTVYMGEFIHQLSDKASQNALNIIEKNQEYLKPPYSDENIRMLNEEGVMVSHIYGIDKYLWDKLELAKDTPFDQEKFASGNYVIVTAFFSDGKDRYYNVGDKVKVDFENGNAKEYEVLAIGNIPSALGPKHSHLIDIYFTLPSTEYLAQMGESGALSAGFDVKKSFLNDTGRWIKNYCENVEPNLDYESREVYVERFKSNQMMFTVTGGVLSIILGLIGILNFINAMITSVIARRRELAMLQGVGMTGKQLKKMLILEGIFYIGSTLIFSMTIGSILCYLGVKAISAQMWFFVYHFTLTPILICMPIFLIVSLIVPIFSYHNILKQNIVERLRDIG